MIFSPFWKIRFKKLLDNPYAGFYFIKKNTYDYFIADNYVPFYKTLTFLTPEETLNYIIDTDSSIIRLGDGEFGLMRGASVYFNEWRQQFKKDLQQALIKVASSHNPKIILCIPGDYITKTKNEMSKEGKASEYPYWINSKILLYKFVTQGQRYGSSFAFYPSVNTHIDYIKLKNYFFKKHIIIITSSLERFKDLELGKTTYLIEAPKSDGWSSLSEIRKTFYSHIHSTHKKKEETLIMVSMGPAAKVFVHELAEAGFTAWDAGQFFDLAYKEIKKLNQTSTATI